MASALSKAIFRASESGPRDLISVQVCRQCHRPRPRIPADRLYARRLSSSQKVPVHATAPPRDFQGDFNKVDDQLAKHTGPRRRQETGAGAPPRRQLRYVPLSFIVLPPLLWYFYQDSQGESMSPTAYTDHRIESTRGLTHQHVELVIPLPDKSAKAFANPLPRPAPAGGSGNEGMAEEAITIHHVMVKNPQLMIERPYTPLNNVERDAELRLLVKRVKGGEVGRHIHGLQAGDDIGLRGPIPTLTITPRSFDRIIMISSGTGIAPFIQLLTKLSPSNKSSASTSSCSSNIPAATPQTSPRHSTAPRSTTFHLLHASPPADQPDWLSGTTYLQDLQRRHGCSLSILRTPSGGVSKADLVPLVNQRQSPGERLIILVCLPPHLLRPLCGPLTLEMGQGELTGLLKEIGVKPHEVWKLD